MLDANAVSDFIKYSRGAIAIRILREPETLSISVIVASELHYGAAKRASPRVTNDVERVLKAFSVEALTPPVDELYGKLRVDSRLRDGRCRRTTCSSPPTP